MARRMSFSFIIFHFCFTRFCIAVCPVLPYQCNCMFFKNVEWYCKVVQNMALGCVGKAAV